MPEGETDHRDYTVGVSHHILKADFNSRRSLLSVAGLRSLLPMERGHPQRCPWWYYSVGHGLGQTAYWMDPSPLTSSQVRGAWCQTNLIPDKLRSKDDGALTLGSSHWLLCLLQMGNAI